MSEQTSADESLPQVVLVLTGNLFFIPRIESAAIRAGMEAVYGNSASGLLKSTAGREIALALVDLESDEAVWTDGIATLTEALGKNRGVMERAPLIAYGPHGDVVTLRRALDQGCDAVLSKRDFSSRLLELMKTRGQAAISS